MRIKAGRRLVKEHDGWISQERSGYGQPLSHPGGVALDRLLGFCFQIHLVEQRVYFQCSCRCLYVIECCKVFQILAAGQFPVETAFAGKDCSHGSANLCRFTYDVVSCYSSGSRCWFQESAEHLYCGCLACTIGAKESEDLPTLDLKTDSIHSNGSLGLVATLVAAGYSKSIALNPTVVLPRQLTGSAPGEYPSQIFNLDRIDNAHWKTSKTYWQICY